MKLAATLCGLATLALTLSAASSNAQGADVPPPFLQTPLVARSAFALQRDAAEPFGGLLARSLGFPRGPFLGREDVTLPPEDGAWKQPFAPGGSLSVGSRSSSAVFASVGLGSLDRPELRSKAKDALVVGAPPRDEERHLGEALARGVLGFVIGRAIGELASERPGKANVKLRSASDPHGKGVGLRLSATW